LTVEDNYNGCRHTGTVNVLDKTQPPVISSPVITSTTDCGTETAMFPFQVVGSNDHLKILVTIYPHGAAFSNTAILVAPGVASNSITVDKTGMYVYTITNTLTGCKAGGIVKVVPGGLTAGLTADKESGYPPLEVNFVNTSTALSSSTVAGQAIRSVWSFGNGTSATGSLMTASALYQAPGTYTVMLISWKGNCRDTAYKVIKVENPSKLEVPNIFTPNGDGSNDVFFLKTASVSEINAVILDRWGNKVYETRSTTGNIAWDGKNFAGNECAAGVYFYVIRGKGRDDKSYEQKGNLTLVR
jgi:gliding motility-associated-like protein